jgi:transcription initiation factor TFIID subunit 11
MLNSQLLQAAGGAGGEAHTSMPPPPPILQGRPAPEDEAEVDDELLPGMADEDYSAQLSFQTQSKDNLKYVLLSGLRPFSPRLMTDLRGYLNNVGFSWTISRRSSMTDSKRTDDTLCLNKQSGKLSNKR